MLIENHPEDVARKDFKQQQGMQQASTCYQRFYMQQQLTKMSKKCQFYEGAGVPEQGRAPSLLGPWVI